YTSKQPEEGFQATRRDGRHGVDHSASTIELDSVVGRGHQSTMKRTFNIGDHVSWNSEAGRIRGTVKKKVTAPMKFKTYTVRASKEEPQYLVQSDKTGHLAMHKGSALRKISHPERVR